MWLVLLSMVIAAGLLIHLAGQPGVIQMMDTQILMGTRVEVTVRARNRGQGESALFACFQEIERIQDLMSTYDKNSEMTRVNRLAVDDWVAPAPEILSLVKTSIEISRGSEGAFDITVGPLVNLWRQAGKQKQPPAAEAVETARTRVGFASIQLDPGENQLRFLKKGMSMDLGGIAKGYALDRAADVLRSEGVEEALLNAGGDILAVGGKGGDPWRVGIRDPRDPDGTLGYLEVQDEAVVTSGDYERFFMHEGRRYHHIIDPRTGTPAWGCRSITVVSDRATEADAVATAAFVLGPLKGFEFLESREGVEGLIVDDRGRRYVTSGLADKIKWNQ
jgi:thiamine biosynthesis lipoprotein